MQTFIEKLNKNNKKFVKVLKKIFSDHEIYFTYISPDCAQLALKKEFDNGVVARGYHLYEYDCKPANGFANLDNRSAKYFSDEKIKKIYIAFMIKNFKEYKLKYLQQTRYKELKNLGETTSL